LGGKVGQKDKMLAGECTDPGDRGRRLVDLSPWLSGPRPGSVADERGGGRGNEDQNKAEGKR
jgi:hypothetical protein